MTSRQLTCTNDYTDDKQLTPTMIRTTTRYARALAVCAAVALWQGIAVAAGGGTRGTTAETELVAPGDDNDTLIADLRDSIAKYERLLEENVAAYDKATSRSVRDRYGEVNYMIEMHISRLRLTVDMAIAFEDVSRLTTAQIRGYAIRALNAGETFDEYAEAFLSLGLQRNDPFCINMMGVRLFRAGNYADAHTCFVEASRHSEPWPYWPSVYNVLVLLTDPHVPQTVKGDFMPLGKDMADVYDVVYSDEAKYDFEHIRPGEFLNGSYANPDHLQWLRSRLP